MFNLEDRSAEIELEELEQFGNEVLQIKRHMLVQFIEQEINRENYAKIIASKFPVPLNVYVH